MLEYWCIQWRSPQMASHAFWYFGRLEEARQAANRLMLTGTEFTFQARQAKSGAEWDRIVQHRESRGRYANRATR